MEHKQIVVTIQKKEAYSGSAERPPVGNFICNGDKFTCWEKEQWDAFNEGSQVLIDYTEKVNESGGKVYTNRNISKISTPQNIVSEIAQGIPQAPIPIQTPQVSPNENPYPGPINNPTPTEFKGGIVEIQGTKYEIILRQI